MENILKQLYQIDSFDSRNIYTPVDHEYKPIDSDFYYPKIFKQMVPKVIDHNAYKGEIIDHIVVEDRFKEVTVLPNSGILIHSIYNDKLYHKAGSQKIDQSNYQNWRDRINHLLHQIDDTSSVRDFLYGHRGRDLSEIQKAFVVNWLIKNKIGIKAVEYPVIQAIYRRGDERAGNISKGYGEFLYNLVVEKRLKKSVEIGLGYGSTALFVSAGHKVIGDADSYHIAIDPKQGEKWNRVGVENIAKLDYHRFKLIEEPSYIALPKLLSQLVKESSGRKDVNRADLCIIGGWNEYQLSLLDLFYCDLIVEKEGYIAVTEEDKSASDELVKFISKNWKHYDRINTVYKSYHVYRKREEDKRAWVYIQNLYSELI